MEGKQDNSQTKPRPGPAKRALIMFFKVLLPLVVVAFAGLVAFHLVTTAPEAKKKKPPSRAPLVETIEARPSIQPVKITAMGTVIPARQITLKSQVGGRIISVSPNFIEGGLLKKGERVVQVEARDYKLAVISQQSQVTQAQYALELEQGHQDVARQEWALLKGKGANAQDSNLALRKPHLKKAKADLASARASLDLAKLNLARTKTTSPFNAVVSVKKVDLGSQVTTQDQLATLVGTDEYWVQTSVPLDRLAWLKIPRRQGQKGSQAKISYSSATGSNLEWEGRVFKLLSSLETEGRMARLLVAVSDPLGLKNSLAGSGARPPLLLGEYVQVEIDGGDLIDVFRLPRNALREKSTVWLVDDKGQLDKKTVRVAWRGRDHVLISEGLAVGDKIIVSDLTSPVQGMAVNTGRKQKNKPPVKSASGRLD